MKNFALSRTTTFILILVSAILIFYVSAEMVLPVALNKSSVSDFEAFHLAGTLILSEGAEVPYKTQRFVEAQSIIPGFDGSLLLWSYPPTFSVFSAFLAIAPVYISYILFMSVSLYLYLWAVKRISNSNYHIVLVLLMPLIAIELRSGQNGLLTGFLICLTCILFLRKSYKCSIPLGFMIIKPHLAVGFGFSLLLQKKWLLAGFSLLVVVLLCIISTIILGFGAWEAFFSSLETTGNALTSGGFPLYRLASIFASGISLGLSVKISMVLHFTVLFLLFIALMVLINKSVDIRYILGFSVLFSAMVSPYNYDYDLAMLAVTAALFCDLVKNHGMLWERWTLMSGAWFIGSYGMIATVVEQSQETLKPMLLSMIGPVLLICAIIILRIVFRTPQSTANEGLVTDALS